MAKEYAKGFYKSRAWQKCRASFIAGRINIDGGLCQHCKERKGYIVDHIEEITPKNINNPDITLNHGNLQYLCLQCHNTKTFFKNKPLNANLYFTEDGEIKKIQLPPLK